MAKESMENTERQFCTFRINDRLYGITIQDIREISLETDFTTIFHAPPAVKGYINVRGLIYLLLDFRQLLGLPEKELDEASRVILFKSEVDENFGILVDGIADIETVDGTQVENRRKQIAKTPEGGERRGGDVSLGVCKLEKGLLIIVNSRNLLNIAIPAGARQG